MPKPEISTVWLLYRFYFWRENSAYQFSNHSCKS